MSQKMHIVTFKVLMAGSPPDEEQLQDMFKEYGLSMTLLSSEKEELAFDGQGLSPVNKAKAPRHKAG